MDRLVSTATQEALAMVAEDGDEPIKIGLMRQYLRMVNTARYRERRHHDVHLRHH